MPIYLDITGADEARLYFKADAILLIDNRYVIKIGEDTKATAPKYVTLAAVLKSAVAAKVGAGE